MYVNGHLNTYIFVYIHPFEFYVIEPFLVLWHCSRTSRKFYFSNLTFEMQRYVRLRLE
jgi:hypothetical protein